MSPERKSTSIRKATTINFFGKYTNIFVQLIYSAILARILSPEDFGVVAVVTVFTTFFSLIANIGIGPAIIQYRNIDEEDINHIFSLTVYIGLGIGILFALFSIPISIFYDDSVYIPIGALLAISLFFNTVNIVPNSLLLKAQRFKLVNLRLVLVSVLSAIPTIILALIGFKYYAIVIHSILVSFITFLWNFSTVKLKFVLKINTDSYKKIREFSSYQFAFSLVNYFSRNLDNLLIGKFIGSSALGFYDKSYRLMLYPVQNLTHVITPVLHPILSAHQDDRAYIYEKYLKVLKVLSLLGVFVSAYCYFAAEEIIMILYGEQWYASVPSFQLLALSIWAQMISSSTGSIFQSIGNTKLMFLTGTVSSVLIVGAILVGIGFDNINMVAGFVTLAFNMNIAISFYYLIKKGLGYSLREFAGKFVPDFIIFLITFVGLYFISQISFDHLLISAIVKGIVAVALFAFGLLITKQYSTVKGILGRK
ncbi:PST family polysaccharide transporter [Alkalibaculum bacchi]|uniref:PST family polysaccharide transporter n=1 Tax=Alkalibaculum bacchi TaxID=645887 RepID=A0A366HXD1_9FIRM|nr:lipopolysaccharide biosynthesis protein [Alkalibaculum bacchi]RBP58227.1 PST family polysaccharide transporter [Alkalibaculum bacchi]